MKWTDEKIRIEAKKFQSRIEFRTKSPVAYYRALESANFIEIFAHMKSLKTTWNKEMLQSEAKKYSMRIDFKKNSPSAYEVARKRGHLKEITSHMINRGGPGWVDKKIKHTKPSLLKDALKYKSRREMSLLNKSAFNAIYKLGISDEAFAHMGIKGNLKSRCIYGIFFPDKKVYFGLTQDFEVRKSQHYGKTNRNIKNEGGLKKGKMIKITKYLPEDQARKIEKFKEKEFEKMGWEVFNIAKPGGLGGSIQKWTRENIFKAASGCKSFREFEIKYPGVIQALNRENMRNEMHLFFGEKINKSWGYWNNFERCQEAAFKSKNITEFNKNHGGAYLWSRKNGWLDIFFPHRKKGIK